MSSLIRWRPMGEVTNLQSEMNTLFDRFFGRGFDTEGTMTSLFPITNVSETNDNVVVTAEIPGLDPKDLDISVTGDLLTIKGERKQEKEEKNEHWHRVERSFGSFTRSFRLPATVVLEKVAADYKNGIVRITMPKTDESKRREVKIKVT